MFLKAQERLLHRYWLKSESPPESFQDIYFLDVSWLEACASGKRASEGDFPRWGSRFEFH